MQDPLTAIEAEAETDLQGAGQSLDEEKEPITVSRPGRIDATNGSSLPALSPRRRFFHAARSASVPASHQSGTVRERRPLAAPTRIRRCGRATSTRTSPTCKLATSLARRPQHVARRKTIKFSRVFIERGALRRTSANTVASSRRVRIFVASARREAE